MDQRSSFIDNDFCFACGTKNPLGMQLSFYRDGEYLCTRVNGPAHWQGFSGIIHGGLQATIMDDLMSNYLLRIAGVWATTAEISCRFKKPVPVCEELVFSACLASHSGRLWEIEGRCRLASDPGGSLLTTAHGRFFEVPRPESC